MTSIERVPLGRQATLHSALRQALDKPFEFAMLRTVPGIGYKLLASDATV